MDDVEFITSSRIAFFAFGVGGGFGSLGVECDMSTFVFRLYLVTKYVMSAILSTLAPLIHAADAFKFWSTKTTYIKLEPIECQAQGDRLPRFANRFCGS